MYQADTRKYLLTHGAVNLRSRAGESPDSCYQTLKRLSRLFAKKRVWAFSDEGRIGRTIERRRVFRLLLSSRAGANMKRAFSFTFAYHRCDEDLTNGVR